MIVKINDIYNYNSDIILGKGAYSTVYKGFNNINEIFAIKKIEYKGTIKKYIDEEINIMKSLNHINIIKLYDVILVADQTIYLILEYCNCGDLKTYIMENICLG